MGREAGFRDCSGAPVRREAASRAFLIGISPNTLQVCMMKQVRSPDSPIFADAALARRLEAAEAANARG